MLGLSDAWYNLFDPYSTFKRLVWLWSGRLNFSLTRHRLPMPDSCVTNDEPAFDRRGMLRRSLALATLPGLSFVQLGCERAADPQSHDTDNLLTDETSLETDKTESINDESAMHVHYLEFVTPDVDAVCTTYSQLYGVTFGEGDPNLGGARTAKLPNGGMLGVRAPMRANEEPVVRPYVLVEDIESSVAAAADAGATIALPPMELKGHGTCAIFIQGGIESGLWQL